MTWFDIRWSGQSYVENLTGADEKTLVLLGMHGYATQAEAEAHPQSMNIIQAAAGGAQILAGYSGSATNIPTVGGAVAGAGTTAAAATTTLGFFQGIWAKIDSRHFWVRMAEGTLGLALILVAVAELAKGTPVGNAVKKVPFI